MGHDSSAPPKASPRKAEEAWSQPCKGSEQSTHHITVSTNRVAHQTASNGPHRIAIPVESRTWELSGLSLPADRPFIFAEIDTAFDAATEIAYEASPAANVQEKRCLETKRVVYYDDSLSGTALPLGQAGSLALPHTTWICAYSPGFLTANYGTRITDADLAAAGYAMFPGDTDGLWWARSARILHDKNRFLLPVGSVDPWGNTSSQSWDSHGLLVEQSTDPLGNTVSVKNHYRTLAPWWITDPNDNHTAARFDALGRVTATFVLGKSTATGYEADFVDAASTEPSATDDPTTTIAYDLATLPVRVQTRARERHRTTVGGATTRWQESWLYTDGLGREILTKVQAEAGEAFAHDSNGDLLRNPDGTPKIQPATTRWVGTGRKVYDNKGNVVKRYEPYFTDTPAFDSEPELVETGVSATLHYDPVNRPIRTDLPDGTFTKVEFTPWVQSTHDANDTVLQSDWYKTRQNSTDPAQKRAAQLAAAHANTPSVAHLDTLGRVVLTITQSDATTTHTTRNTLDLEGNLLRQDVSRDASTTLTVLTQTFDILGRVCMARHPDSGAKLIWRDVASQTLRSWDSPNTVDERSQGFEYDQLRRPLRRWVNGATTYLAEETTYGESLPDAKARNARGQAYSHKDGAGIATDEQRDFQGKVTKSVRQLTTSTTKDVPDWSKSVAVDETFTTLTAYDALGRVIQIDTPHNNNVPASQVFPIYNEANLLDRLEASLRGATTRTTFVQNIDYDAKGQRQRITYGNGATTRYQYDPLTWRLTNLLTTRNNGTDTLQNLSYTYDPIGNVVQITDDAQQTVFFNNQVVTATALYEYDALYRLTQSTGREHLNNGDATEPEAEGFNTPQNLPSDGQSLRNYMRSWTYDHVGNILSLIHTATNGNWTRNYAYATDSNRLATTTVGSVTQTYTHNAHGSFTAMPHLDAMEWTADERLLHVKRGTSQTWYTYDSTGQRVRKVTEKGGITEERLYLGGWEIYRKRQGTTVVLERETLHLMDGARRIAMVETKTVDASSTSALPSTVTRYQLDNHLQSASLELDETASVISYEEYYPFGDTSYRSARSGMEVSEKRYRYTGKEKDEESGLYYHGARYYAAWLGRWTAADPAGMVDGACLYAYVRNHPTGLVDPDGRAGVFPREQADASSVSIQLPREDLSLARFQKAFANAPPADPVHQAYFVPKGASHPFAVELRREYQQRIQAEIGSGPILDGPLSSIFYQVATRRSNDVAYHKLSGELGVAADAVAFAGGSARGVRSQSRSPATNTPRPPSRDYANGSPLEPLSPRAVLRLDASPESKFLGEALALEAQNKIFATPKQSSLAKSSNPIQDLLYGLRPGEGLPGSMGISISKRPTVTELENLSEKHGVEFAVTYKLGPGPNGSGGQYKLFSGTRTSVQVPIAADEMLINHTHPGGTAYASSADVNVLKLLKAAQSPQRSSQIIPVGGTPFRFGINK